MLALEPEVIKLAELENKINSEKAKKEEEQDQQVLLKLMKEYADNKKILLKKKIAKTNQMVFMYNAGRSKQRQRKISMAFAGDKPKKFKNHEI